MIKVQRMVGMLFSTLARAEGQLYLDSQWNPSI